MLLRNIIRSFHGVCETGNRISKFLKCYRTPYFISSQEVVSSISIMAENRAMQTRVQHVWIAGIRDVYV